METNKNDFSTYIEKGKTSYNIISSQTYINSKSSTVDLTNLYTNMNHISDSLKIINTYPSDYNIYSTEISYNNKNEYFYDDSNSFPDNNNTEIYNQIENYISKNYSVSEKPNIIIKGESDFIYQITTTEKEKELIKKNVSEEDYNISMIDFTECEQLLKK